MTGDANIDIFKRNMEKFPKKYEIKWWCGDHECEKMTGEANITNSKEI